MQQRIPRASSSKPPQQVRNAGSIPPLSTGQAFPNSAPTPEEMGNEAFNQNQFEAYRIQLKEKHGPITPVEQERLGVLQTKMNDFWAERRQRPTPQPNLREILARNDQIERGAASQLPAQSSMFQVKGEAPGKSPTSANHLILQRMPVADGVIQRAFGAEDSLKLQVAHLLESILKDLKIPAYLGGGAAAAVLGSGRAIQDLDYKMSEEFQKKWRDESQRHEITNDIVSALTRAGLTVNVTTASPYVLKLEIDKPESSPVEISLTSTGNYSGIGAEQVEVELDQQQNTSVTVISRDDLLLDKLFAFAERAVSNAEKLATDFIDIVTVLMANPYPYLSASGLEQRWVAYRKKWKREDKDPYGSGYLQMAPMIGLQIAMRTTLLTQDRDLQQAKGLRWLRLGSQMVGKFAATVEKVAKADRLLLRDEILAGAKGEVGNEEFQKLSKREQSEILQTMARLRKKKERLQERDRRKTAEYVATDSQLFDLWMQWGIDLDFY